MVVKLWRDGGTVGSALAVVISMHYAGHALVTDQGRRGCNINTVAGIGIAGRKDVTCTVDVCRRRPMALVPWATMFASAICTLVALLYAVNRVSCHSEEQGIPTKAKVWIGSYARLGSDTLIYSIHYEEAGVSIQYVRD